MSGFFEMGGYGAFIWPAYGFALLVLGGLLLQSLRQYRTRQRELARLQARR